jgi:hypothetical protein
MRSACLATLWALALTAALPGEGANPSSKKTFERSYPFVGNKDLKIGIRHGDVTIEAVRIRNWPDAEERAKGERDLDDTHTMVVEFTYSNRDEDHDYKCRYQVVVPGKDGAAWAENDRTATLDKGKIGDTNKMFVKMKTHRYRKARNFRITYELWRK